MMSISGIDLSEFVKGQPLLFVLLLGAIWVLWNAYRESVKERAVDAREAVKVIEANNATLKALLLATERRREDP